MFVRESFAKCKEVVKVVNFTLLSLVELKVLEHLT
jgi:hypothetical protein